MAVFTIGYEGLDIDEFMSLLKEHGIETLVDIRETPLSRKPGFSKNSLAGRVRTAGLSYIHLVELGCPKPVRDRHRRDRSWKRYTEGFLRHLAGQEEALSGLAGMATSTKCALMCFEADHNFCHRSLVAGAIRKLTGADVLHIQAKSATLHLPFDDPA